MPHNPLLLLSRCISWYDDALDDAPLVTKAVTAATLGLLGDAAAQLHEARLPRRCQGGEAAREEGPEQEEEKRPTVRGPRKDRVLLRRRQEESGQEEEQGEESPAAPSLCFRRQSQEVEPPAGGLCTWYDTRRGIVNVANNLLLAAPVYHYIYEWLEELFPIFEDDDDDDDWTNGGAVAALCQVLVDCVLFDAIFVAFLFLSSRWLEGRCGGAADREADVSTSLWLAVAAGWKVNVYILPVEFALFRYCPLRWRLLGVNVIDLVWEASMSFVIHDEGARSQERDEEVMVALVASKIDASTRSQVSTAAPSPWPSPSSNPSGAVTPPEALLLSPSLPGISRLPLPIQQRPQAVDAKKKQS